MQDFGEEGVDSTKKKRKGGARAKRAKNFVVRILIFSTDCIEN